MSPRFDFSKHRNAAPQNRNTASRKAQSDAQLLEAWNTPSPIAPVGEDTSDGSLETVDLAEMFETPVVDADPEVELPEVESEDSAEPDGQAAQDIEVDDADAELDADDSELDEADAAIADEGGNAGEAELEFVTAEDETETEVATELDGEDSAIAESEEATAESEAAAEDGEIEAAEEVAEDAGGLDSAATETAEAEADDAETETETEATEAEDSEAVEGEDDPEAIAEDEGDEAGETDEDEEATEDELDEEEAVEAIADLEPQFKSGTFTVGESGQVGIDWLWDGGRYRGQLGIFSLDGLDEFEAGSEDFIREMTARVLSGTESGHLAIDDASEGARFPGKLDYEEDHNSGEYQGVKTFAMRAGDTFGLAIVPDGTFVELAEDPNAGGALRPLFSMVTANPNEQFQMGQIVDLTGDGNVFAFEDLRLDGRSDRDYNDMVVQVRGAVGHVDALADDFINPDRDWRESEAGQLVVEYAKPYVTPVAEPALDGADGTAAETDPAAPGEFDDAAASPEDPAEATDSVIDPDPADRATSSDADELAAWAAGVAPAVVPDAPVAHQPLIGIVDTGFAANSPDLNYDNITLGQDRVGGDRNPLLEPGEVSKPGDDGEHGTRILGIIAAQQGNDLGIDGVNDDAPIWLGRAIGSGDWADSLREFVDAAKESGQPNAVVNLSLDLTETDAAGNTFTRYELTPAERAAIEYARQNDVLIVAAAGNDGGVMSALGQASREFDNIITVGAAERLDYDTSIWQGSDRADYSSYGPGLDLVAEGGTVDNPQLSLTGDGLAATAGTSVATARVTGAASQVWAANPDLSYHQAIEILKQTATDLGETGRDLMTGGGMLNLAAAISLAKIVEPETHATPAVLNLETWSGEGKLTPGERAVQHVVVPPDWRREYYGWLNDSNPADTFTFTLNQPTPLQFSLDKLQGNVTLKQGTRTIATGTYDSLNNQLYGSSGGMLQPGSYTLTVARKKAGDVIDPYRVRMNFIEKSGGKEIPIVNFLPRPTAAQPPNDDPTDDGIDDAAKRAAEQRARDAIAEAYRLNRAELGNNLHDVQVHWKSFDGTNVPAVQYFDGGYIIWNGVQAVVYQKGTGLALPAIDLPPTTEPLWHQVTPFPTEVPAGRHEFLNKTGASAYLVDLKGKTNDLTFAIRDTALTKDDLRMTVYRKRDNGSLEQVPLTTATPDDNLVDYQDLNPGQYLVWVDVAQDRANVPYKMTVNADQAGDTGTEAWNINGESVNGRVEGQRIVVSDHIGLPSGDRDLYTFTTGEMAALLQFAVRRQGQDEDSESLLDGNVKMRLLDADGKEISTMDSVSRKPTLDAKWLKPNSKYYVEVTAKPGDKTNYDLVLNFDKLQADGRHEFSNLQGQFDYKFSVSGTERDFKTTIRDVNGEDMSNVYRPVLYRIMNGTEQEVLPDSTKDRVFHFDTLPQGEYRMVAKPVMVWSPEVLDQKYTLVHNLDQAGDRREDARDLGNVADWGDDKRTVVKDHVGAPAFESDFYKFKTDDQARVLQLAVRTGYDGTDAGPLDGDLRMQLLDKNGKIVQPKSVISGKNSDGVIRSHYLAETPWASYDLEPNSEYSVKVEPLEKVDSSGKVNSHKTNYYLVANASQIRAGAPGNYYPNIDAVLNNYFSDRAGWQGKSLAEKWDRIGGDSAQYGPYALYSSPGEMTKSLPTELLAIYEDLSKTVVGSANSVTAGYAYDLGYEEFYDGSHSGIDIDTIKRERLNSATDGVVVYSQYHYNDDGSPNGQWIAVDETVDGQRTGRRWWYGHLDEGTIPVGKEVKAGEQIGITGNGEGYKHHLHLTVVDTYAPVSNWNEVINGKGGNYNQNVSNVLRRTMNPLQAYWKSQNGIKE